MGVVHVPWKARDRYILSKYLIYMHELEYEIDIIKLLGLGRAHYDFFY